MTPAVEASTQVRAEFARWLRGLRGGPAAVAQHLEFAHAFDFGAMSEALLADLVTDTGRGFPSRRPSGAYDWKLPRWFGPVRAHGDRAAHLAGALALACRSDGTNARRLRRLHRFELPNAEPWWLHDGLEHFSELVAFCATSAWHREAVVPRRLFCLPQVREITLSGCEFGDAALAGCAWELPLVEHLSLANNGLTEVPAAVAWLTTLRSLNLRGNPIHTLPAAVASLPHLHSLDLRGTAIRALPTALRERREVTVILPCGEVLSAAECECGGVRR